ncbi:MAG: LLM class F420-dependent oxidoreductase [Acidimicrobiia bacterium]
MDFGVVMFPTDLAIRVTELGKAAEERGFDSIWFPEHTHIPTSRLSSWPGGPGLPEEYKRTLDPFAALAAVASVTERILLGTGICLVVERDPITLAKQVASVDHLSDGRLLFGIGGGWNREEMENHGTQPAQRWRLMRERVLAMKEIWTNEVAEFHGDLVDFGPLWQWPKPTRQPHPPVIVAGNGPGTFERILEYGDGWMPIPGSNWGGSLESRVAELGRLAEERGRGPIPVSVFGCPSKPEVVEHYAACGVVRCIFRLPPAPADVVLPKLDVLAQLAGKFR